MTDKVKEALERIAATNASKHGTMAMMLERCITLAKDALSSLSEAVPVAYACHIDDTEQSDCVIDAGCRNNCSIASKGIDKEQCEYWQPIKVIAHPLPSTNPVGEAQQEKDAALQFADHIINGVFEGGDFDGGELQDLAVKYGLLTPEEMQAPCNEDGCNCADNLADFPTICFRKTYLAAIAAKEPK